MRGKYQVVLLLLVYVNSCLSEKPLLTLDEFFNATSFSFVKLSPNDGQSILIQTKYRIWDRNVSEEHLYFQRLSSKDRTLITTQASSYSPLWKGEFIALILANSSTDGNKRENLSDQSQYIHLYSTRTGQMSAIPVGKESIRTYTWSTTSMSIYFATRTPWTDATEEAYEKEWRDVIEYREQFRGDSIYRADIENMTLTKIEFLTNISLRVVEMVCSPDGKRLIYSTQPSSLIMEQMTDYELYSLDLTRQAPITPLRLTNNQAIEANLKWPMGESLFFTVIHSGSLEGPYEDSQGRLYDMDVTTRQIQRWATNFNGQVAEYALLEGGRGGVVILGQLSTEIQVYTQASPTADLIKQNGWNGSYQNIATASIGNSSTIAFVHSSYQKAQEVYFAENINQLSMAQPVTDENQLFSERSLPQGKTYRWINEDDGTEIEGVLLYPPGKFEQKNLPLFVLIHGGPYNGDVNVFLATWYKCEVMMATEGWLVLQPNYRGSVGMRDLYLNHCSFSNFLGYGDEFMRAVRIEIVSGPGRDILYGVDALIRDGIVDPTKLTVGGYSYGGYLTNWLITQTTRFNAAVSGAGAVEHVADWGLSDEPITSIYFFGGYPWQVSGLYQREGAIFQIDRARTPTHIVVPGSDNRVSSSENFILERALHALNVTNKLIILPGESHIIGNNPWHEKIKVREELKWLHKYGNITVGPLGSLVNSAVGSKSIPIQRVVGVVFALLFCFMK